jgi:hypothetical protein
MAVIGFLLFFIIPIIFLYSLFKPEKFNIRTKKNENGRWTRVQSLAAFTVAWLTSIIMLVQSPLPETTNEQNADVEPVQEKKPVKAVEPEPIKKVVEKKEVIKIEEDKQSTDVIDDKQAKLNKIIEVGITLGITPKEYGQKFNKLIKRAGLKETDWSNFGLKLSKQEYLDSFVIDYPADITLVGAVDKNGELKSLEYQVITSMLDKTSDNVQKVALNLALLSAVSTKILNPEVSEDEALQFASNLIGDAATKFAETEKSQREVKIMGDNAYIVQANKIMVTFRIVPKASDEHRD